MRFMVKLQIEDVDLKKINAWYINCVGVYGHIIIDFFFKKCPQTLKPPSESVIMVV